MDANWTPEAVGSNHETLILAIDVIPYYILPQDFPDVKAWWFIVGNNYPTYPGTYLHSDKGGSFTISSDS